MDTKEKNPHNTSQDVDADQFDPFALDILHDISKQPVIEKPEEIEQTDYFSPFPVSVIRDTPASIVTDGRNGRNMPANIGSQIGAAIAHRKEGRLSLLTLERAVNVIEGIENGITMDEIAKEIGTTRQTIWSWMQLLPEFRDGVACAREFQAHSYADDAVNVLDNVGLDPNNPKAGMAELRKAEQKARIRMQLAECFHFKQYGAKKRTLNTNIDIEISPIDLSKYS